MSMVPHRVLAIAAVSLLSLGALSACATPTTDPPTPGAGGESAAPDPGEESASGPECLVGDWYIAEDQMQAFYTAVSATNDGLDITVDGGTGLSFSAATYTYTPDFAIVLQVAGAEAEGSISGGISGDYSATEAEITTSHEVSNVALSVTVSGITIDGTELVGDILASAPINSAPYECGDVGPIISFDTGDGNPRVPIQLTPAS